MGDEKISYDGPVSTPTADLTTFKIHCNSVLSTLDGKYSNLYVKKLYLNNPTKRAEYFKIALKIIPKEIINKYDPSNKQYDE